MSKWKSVIDGIIESYLDWKKDRDDNYVYDEINEFFSQLDRSEKLELIEYVILKRETPQR